MKGTGLKTILTGEQICDKRTEIEVLITRAVSLLGDADKISREIGMQYGIYNALDRHSFYGIGGNDADIVKKIIKNIDRAAWRSVIETGGFRELMSVKEKRKMDDYIADAPPLTYETLKATFAGLMQNRPDMLKDLIETAFIERDKKYKSNQGMKINKRQVINGVFDSWGYRNCYGYRVERLQDIVKAVSLVNGEKPPEVIPELQRAISNNERYYTHGVMRFRAFKKRQCSHLYRVQKDA